MSFDFILRVLQVGLGIGLVIFVHELGHFLAARWCKVRVEVFSLGFGPQLIGWKRGGTTYQIAVVPFGGYVRMAGEIPDGDRRAPAPDELGAKSVPARLLIYSGGVIMNVIFALVCFPIALGAGVPVDSPVIDHPAAGSPAWRAGVPGDSWVVEVDGRDIWEFGHLFTGVALAGSDQVEIVLDGPNGRETFHLQPEREEDDGFFHVGLPPGPQLGHPIEVVAGGAAAQAGLRTGDRFLGISGWPEGMGQAETARALTLSPNPLTVIVERDGERKLIEFNQVVSDPGSPLFGFAPQDLAVQEVRRGGPAESIGILAGDVIYKVRGEVIHSSIMVLRHLAAPGPNTLAVIRDGEFHELDLSELGTDQALEAWRDMHLGLDGTSIRVYPGSPMEQAGAKSGDRIVAIQSEPVQEWAEAHTAAGLHAADTEPVSFLMERRGLEAPIEIFAQAAPLTGLLSDFRIQPAHHVHQTHGILPSIRAGAISSWRFLQDTWMTLKRMATREVSPRNLGGIVMISKVSYEVSGMGWAKLLFFLCILSVNLAVLNVLPIPVLDGGHIFFLLVEAVKGSPVSERTLGYSQVVGLVLIVSLMVYVTYNDILRFIPGAG
tara:strand:- start:230 stop:2041 length:1812 start_codon:yes stop_codon:yes gene_type:complete